MNLQTRSIRSLRAAAGGDVGSLNAVEGNSIGSRHQQYHPPSGQSSIIQHAFPHQQQQHHGPQHVQQQQQQEQFSVEERNQIIFRKVRGILNKLTPEKFDKLGDQLIGLGLDSVAILKGVILLIFEKAIEEPKYCSMYAQLCKKLSRELNFLDNTANSNTTATSSATGTTVANSNETNTFCRLLLIKCRDEFDNRLKATEKFREKFNNNNSTNTTTATTSSSQSQQNISPSNTNNKNNNGNNNNNSAIGPRGSLQLTDLSTMSQANSGVRRGSGMQRPSSSSSGKVSNSTTSSSSLASGASGANAILRKLSDEEEEQMSIAKSKMLGNIRFICELGRQGLVQENILHVCIKQLVSKRKDESISSKSEDLECLCQIMKTVGKLLDTEKAKNLMDQYFERIIFYSTCQELPSRIRFMLKDVIELRDFKWQPRRVQRENGPRPIAQIREEAARDLGISPTSFWDMATVLQGISASAIRYPPDGSILMPPPPGVALPFPPSPYHQPFCPQTRLPLFGHPVLPLVSNPGQRALDDMGYYANFGSSPLLGSGPGTIREDPRHTGTTSMRRTPQPMLDSFTTSNQGIQQRQHQQSHHHQNNNTGSHVQGHMPYRGSSSQEDPRGKRVAGRGEDLSVIGNRSNMPGNGRNSIPNSNPSSRMMVNTQKGGLNLSGNQATPNNPILPAPVQKMPPIEKISLRPAQNSMVLKPLGGSVIRNDALTAAAVKQSPAPDTGALSNGKVTTESKQAQAATQPAPAPPPDVKEVLLKKVNDLIEQLFTGSIGVKDMTGKLKELKNNKNIQPEVVSNIMKGSFTRNDKEKEVAISLLTTMKDDNLIVGNAFMKSLQSLLADLCKLELDDPLIKTHIAEFIGSFVCKNILNLKEAYKLVGDKYPMFFLVLQHMSTILEKDVLRDMLDASKINLVSILPEGDRSKEQLSDILDKRGLSFLQPLIRIEFELKKLLKSNETNSPANVYKWIKENVDESLHTNKGFILLMYTNIFRHIIKKSDQEANQSSKSLAEVEKEWIKNFRPILTAFISTRASLQLAALYALQSVCHEMSFPKGLLLRWFNNLYDQEIIDEEIFLQWKEDLNDEFPGKGQALFQVNTWLIWLAETEADSEEDDDDEEAE